jgi:hypothetical protein
MREGDMVEIIAGIDPGAQVVTAGQMKIMDGSKVQPLGDAAMNKTGNDEDADAGMEQPPTKSTGGE